MMKFDPYLNVDPGSHLAISARRSLVTDDGAETDLDLGHYERFTHAPLSSDNNLRQQGPSLRTDHFEGTAAAITWERRSR